jgi:NAD(P)H-hydrate epimerase
MRALSRDEVRAVDRRALEVYGIPTLLLMENAGAGLARAVQAHLGSRGLERARVLVVCGKGGNGGDGLVLARHLALGGHEPRVALAFDPAKADHASDAGTNLTIVERLGVPIERAADGEALRALLARTKADLIADALLGTGVADEVREPHRGIIEAMNGSGIPIAAVDLPSGLDADTGKPLGVAVRAAFTVTFAAPKLGFAHAREWTGPVVVVSIGCPV